MEKTDIKIEEIKLEKLSKITDGFGRFQIVQYILICIPLLFVSMMNVNYVFVAGDVDYRCKVPECENEQELVNRPSWWPLNVDEKCLQPIIDDEKFNGICTNTSFLDKVGVCEEWIYKSNDSIVAELNLACQSWKATLVGSIHNAGMIASMMLLGWISDRYGRKPAIVICAVGGGIGVLKIFLTSYYAFIAVEFLESAISSGLYTVAIVLMIETGGQSTRVLAGVIFSCAVYVGESIFAFIAIAVPYWKHLILIIYSPAIIFVLYLFLLRESTRWQMLKGKIKEVKETLVVIANVNNNDLSSTEILDLNDEELRKMFTVEADKTDKVVLKDILESKEIMKRLGVASFAFFSAGFVYYGLTVNSVLLPGNKYTNFILSSVSSFPGDILAYFTFNRFGRRVSLIYGFMACGVFCVATAYSPDCVPWLKILLFLCGKMAVALCCTGMYTYSLELFPTSVRGSLVAFCNTGARIGSMLAPLTPLLATTMSELPTIFFAGSAVIAGVLLTLTPETKNLPLVDTIAQMENLKATSITTL